MHASGQAGMMFDLSAELAELLHIWERHAGHSHLLAGQKNPYVFVDMHDRVCKCNVHSVLTGVVGLTRRCYSESQHASVC